MIISQLSIGYWQSAKAMSTRLDLLYQAMEYDFDWNVMNFPCPHTPLFFWLWELELGKNEPNSIRYSLLRGAAKQDFVREEWN